MLKRTAHTGRRSRLALLIILLTVSICVRLPGLFSRAIWEDESVTLLETAGHAVPTWPPEPAPARFAKSQFQGRSTLTQITRDLKFHDSHPPLYYWSVLLWQRCWGSSLNATRAFSLVCSFATILVLYAFLSVADFES